MPGARVDIDVTQGEDFTSQIVWNDFTDNPIRVVTPMRMQIKSQYGQVMTTLDVPDPPLPETEIPPLTYNTDSGMIQIHMSKDVTNAIPSGIYAYDLFCNVDDGEAFAGYQQVQLMYGNLNCKPRITIGI